MKRRPNTAAAVAAIKRAVNERDTPERHMARGVEIGAEMVLAMMRGLHGGTWSIHIDHDVGFAVIRRH